MTSSNKKNCYYPRASEPASTREIVKESYLVLGFKALSTALSHLRTRERERGRETERDRDRERETVTERDRERVPNFLFQAPKSFKQD